MTIPSLQAPGDVSSVDRPDGATLADGIRREAKRLGFARVGIAAAGSPPHHEAFRGWLAAGMAGVMEPWLARHESLRQNLDAIMPGARSVVMLAMDYGIGTSPGCESLDPGHGRVARYARGDDYHDLLRERLNTIVAWLQAHSPGSHARGVVDSAPVAERDFAQLAGLGWFGKNTMLIDPRAGSYFLLATLVTDIDLPTDQPILTDHCGTCTACLDACPTGAFPAPRVLDATKCISAITIEDHGPMVPTLREGIGDWVFGCDICQEVCPWNRYAPGSEERAFQSRDPSTSLELAEILALDAPGFRDRFRGSPILRAKRRGLLRSAAIALGNRPHPPAFDSLASALADTEPVVRGAAAWALGHWVSANIMPTEALAVLEARLATEAEATVRAEIIAALAVRHDDSAQSRISSMSKDGSRPGPSSP